MNALLRSARASRAISFVLAALVFAACEAPPVFPGADRRQQTHLGRIEGDVVVSSAARGRIILFLFDANRPPPPTGTGRPLAFTVVSQDDVFHGAPAGTTGPFVAPFAFSLVPAGEYLLRGFIDANTDFIPWYGVTADANRGDVGGAAVDASTRAYTKVVVAEDEDGNPVAATGVSVSFADSSTVPVDRPVFQAGPAVTLGASPVALDLTVRPIDERDEPGGVIFQGQPVFLAQLADADGDRQPDLVNGVPQMLWPRVIVRKLAGDVTSNLVDENDLDKNGVLDDAGEDYDGDGVPDLVVLAAGINPATLMPQLLDGMGEVKTTPTPLTALPIVIQPLALDAKNPAAPKPLGSLPEGRYAVTVIQPTGQTWRLPNELAPGVAEERQLTPYADQGFVITVE